MLGHRGCRLGITFPEIYRMQVRAIIEAACAGRAESGVRVQPEIMIPLVAHVSELARLRDAGRGRGRGGAARVAALEGAGRRSAR